MCKLEIDSFTCAGGSWMNINSFFKKTASMAYKESECKNERKNFLDQLRKSAQNKSSS
jgi:hypothetical protein